MWQKSSRTLSGMPLSPKRAGSVAYSLTMFVIVSVLAGVLVADGGGPERGQGNADRGEDQQQGKHPGGRAH